MLGLGVANWVSMRAIRNCPLKCADVEACSSRAQEECDWTAMDTLPQARGQGIPFLAWLLTTRTMVDENAGTIFLDPALLGARFEGGERLGCDCYCACRAEGQNGPRGLSAGSRLALLLN